jgi:signal transduction histidine kinase
VKIFDKAILRLTAIYSGILIIICVGFSTIIYVGACHVIEDNRRPLPDNLVWREVMEEFIAERNKQIEENMLTHLMVVNVSIVLTGTIISYFGARQTLKPIHDNMEMQKQFIANASHELRTPLTNMSMENEVLLRDDTAKKDDYKKQIISNQEEVVALAKLTDQLLTLSKNEPLPLENLQVEKIVEQVIDKIKPLADHKAIAIDNQIKTLSWSANHWALGEIILIMLDNAIKYSPEKSVITLQNEAHKIMIVDRGGGISKEDLPHLFERFYRADKAHHSHGYGLGLSLAAHLASKQNLHLSAENNTNQPGATFIIAAK